MRNLIGEEGGYGPHNYTEALEGPKPRLVIEITLRMCVSETDLRARLDFHS